MPDLDIELVPAEHDTPGQEVGLAGRYWLRRGPGEYTAFTADPALAVALRTLEAASSADRVAAINVQLREMLAGTGWDTVEDEIRAAIAADEPVSLTIRCAAEELFALPWELLQLGKSAQSLGSVRGLTLRYAWPGLGAPPPPPAAQEGGRLLLAWAAPRAAVHHDAHLSAIQRLIRSSPAAAGLEVLPDASPSALSLALRAARAEGRPFTMVQLLCHGAAQGRRFVLELAGEGNQPHTLVPAAQLARLLQPHRDTVRVVLLTTCHSADPGALALPSGAPAQELHKRGIAAVVAARFPISQKGAVLLTERLYRSLLVDLEDIEQAIWRGRQQLRREGEDPADWATVQLYACPDQPPPRPFPFCPFRGLAPFGPAYQGLFFGRDAERARIAQKLSALRAVGAPQALFVLGPPGCGRTSLLEAGVLPALLGDEPPAGAACRSVAAAAAADPPPRVVLLDPPPPGALAVLWALLERAPETTALIALPEEAVSSTEPLGPGLTLGGLLASAAHADHRLWLKPLRGAQLRAVIAEPARRLGISLEAGLLEELVAHADEVPDALPLLQYTLQALWRERRGVVLRLADYHALGGLAGVLAGRADAVLDGLSDDARAQARRLLGLLVRRQGSLLTLAPLPVAWAEPLDEAAAPAAREALAALRAGGLVVARDGTLWITHHTLLRRWERLRLWCEADAAEMADLHAVLDAMVAWEAHQTLPSLHLMSRVVRAMRAAPRAVPAAVSALCAAWERHPAERGRRILARIIDDVGFFFLLNLCGIFGMVLMLASVMFPPTPAINLVAVVLLKLASVACYFGPPLLWVTANWGLRLWRGQSIGKRALHIQVRRRLDAQVPGAGRMIWRTGWLRFGFVPLLMLYAHYLLTLAGRLADAGPDEWAAVTGQFTAELLDISPLQPVEFLLTVAPQLFMWAWLGLAALLLLLPGQRPLHDRLSGTVVTRALPRG